MVRVCLLETEPADGLVTARTHLVVVHHAWVSQHEFLTARAAAWALKWWEPTVVEKF
jgi:hypothetical protein